MYDVTWEEQERLSTAETGELTVGAEEWELTEAEERSWLSAEEAEERSWLSTDDIHPLQNPCAPDQG